jgi:hypothetical protein
MVEKDEGGLASPERPTTSKMPNAPKPELLLSLKLH